MFGLSFLTTLNIYKDYFEGRKRLHKLHKSTSVKKSVTGNLVWPSSSFSWRSCCVCTPRVLWSSNFMIFIVWWIEELCNQHSSQVGDQVAYWDSRNWLVTYWEPCIERRDYHYRTSPIGYWGKGSIVGWYKVLRFLYLLPFVLIIVDSREWWP